MSKKNKQIIMIVGGVVAAILIFFCGVRYGQSKTVGGNFGPGAGRQFGQGGMMGRTGGMRMMGNFVSGQIVSNDGQSMVLKLVDGGSRTILVASSTQVQKFQAGSPSDLTAGENVTVTGSTNADGSVSAQTIQLRPAGATFGGQIQNR